MERAILGGGRSFQFNGRTLRWSAYRLHRRTCYTNKEPQANAWSSESGGYLLSHNHAVPSAMLCLCCLSLRCPRPSPLRCLPPLPAPLLSALSPAPARRRRAQPTPRMAHTAPHSATPPPMRQTRGGKRRLFLTG